MNKRGVVWIAPLDPVPSGLMADPVKSVFWVSWQHDEEGLLGDAEILGAEEAIAWGRQRAERIRIRLGHTDDTYFSAGEKSAAGLPRWPPNQRPPGGWWLPGDPRTPPPPEAEPGQIGVLHPTVVRTELPDKDP